MKLQESSIRFQNISMGKNSLQTEFRTQGTWTAPP